MPGKASRQPRNKGLQTAKLSYSGGKQANLQAQKGKPRGQLGSHLTGRSRAYEMPKTRRTVWPFRQQGEGLLRRMATGKQLSDTQAALGTARKELIACREV